MLAESAASGRATRVLQLPVRASNAHSGPVEPHAASFNAASNRSRAERGEGFVTRDLFEASRIPMIADTCSD
jgi:hypothetical protein